MAESLLSPSVLRNLCDKLYERRKIAVYEVEGVIRSMVASNQNEKIQSIIRLIVQDFVLSPQVYHRQGGLLALAGITVGLQHEHTRHLNTTFLNMIFSPVLKALMDQDSRVRYSACEALYNIVKVAREDLSIFFNRIFDALCNLSADTDPKVQHAVKLLNDFVKDVVKENEQFKVEEFIPVLRDRMNVPNPFVRRFLVEWIIALDDLPQIGMLSFLPEFLDGLFNMLSDIDYEIRQQADSALSEFLLELKNAPGSVVDYGRIAKILVEKASSSNEFTRLTAMQWINEFVKSCRHQLTPYLEEILEAILLAISDKEEKIVIIARETSDVLRTADCNVVDRGALLKAAQKSLGSASMPTRFEALKWILTLLERHRMEVLSFLDDLFPALLQALSDESEEVVLEVLKVQACIAQDTKQFHMLIVLLLQKFQTDKPLFERRASLVLRHLCVFLGAETVYREIAAILQGEANLEFAAVMVQVLNVILLTASELEEMRALLRQTWTCSEARDLFAALYASWCHSPVATLSLCLLAEAYDHAFAIIQSLEETDFNPRFYVQLEKLVRLLEFPVFAPLRLQLLDLERSQSPAKPLYGLLMLLPQQTETFKLLESRLKSIRGYTPTQTHPGSSKQTQTQLSRTRLSQQQIDFAQKLQEFEMMQRQHRQHRAEEARTSKLTRVATETEDKSS